MCVPLSIVVVVDAVFTTSTIAILRRCLQRNAVVALANLVSDHKCNQSAAAAAEAILHLMQLTMSSDAAFQQKAVINLGYLVWNHHYCN